MSKIEVNTVAPQCGTTLTLGESGDTVQLGTGASQSGFGRTGTVDWQTGSIKTSTFTAVNGQGFFCDTNGGAFTVNLPAGSAGAIVSLQDYRNTFDTANLTVDPNGSEKINGGEGPVVLNTEGEGITLVYIDSTVGWRSIQDNDFASVGSNFIAATGGTITNTPTCRIHTFTGPGTFQIQALSVTPANNVLGYLVVGGGGSGGDGGTGEAGGGGGAGGFREGRTNPITPYTVSPLAVATGITATITSFPIQVGGGGGPGLAAGNPAPSPVGNNGTPSVFSSITSAGGGFGSGGGASSGFAGTGGSGGGGNGRCGPGTPGNSTGKAGNTPPVSPPQGNNGGNGYPSPGNRGGAGGGATAVGGNAQCSPNSGGGFGGAGATTHITGSPVAYAGGGGGGNQSGPHPTGGTGGTGGGGNGGKNGPVPDRNGTGNTGGGGGGNSCGQNFPSTGAGGNGGSGVVIIRYKIA
jgi:hypothetical protein